MESKESKCENNPVNVKIREEGGERGALSAVAEIPLPSLEETTMEQIFPCS